MFTKLKTVSKLFVVAGLAAAALSAGVDPASAGGFRKHRHGFHHHHWGGWSPYYPYYGGHYCFYKKQPAYHGWVWVKVCY